jgi:hypothetical protein
MPTCLKVSYAGVPSPQPIVFFDSTASKVATPYTLAQPLFIDAGGNTSTCAMLTLTGAEYAALLANSSSNSGTTQTPTPQGWQELMSLSIADAQVISGYIGLLWASVWGIKQVIKSLSFYERNQDE